jgi:hypothetical protein
MPPPPNTLLRLCDPAFAAHLTAKATAAAAASAPAAVAGSALAPATAAATASLAAASLLAGAAAHRPEREPVVGAVGVLLTHEESRDRLRQEMDREIRRDHESTLRGALLAEHGGLGLGFRD